jgi:2-methylisocitrate lyase-like PEP mutase family enzyme
MTDRAASAPARLRDLLAGDTMVVAPFCYDGLQAKLAVAAGFEAVYCTGYGTAASHGLADVGLLGLAEMAANGRRLARAVEVPVVADADTGFGNAVNVAHTVAEYASSGLAALHIEDQVWPKRCGFMGGKEVIPRAEAAQKVRAAVDAAGPDGPVVIARTDALAPHGWDEVEARARAFREVGAELVFVDGLRSRRDVETCAERLGDLPLVYNGMLAVADVAPLGFRLNLNPAPLLAGFAALEAVYRTLGADGRVAVEGLGTVFDRLNGLLGLADVEALRERYGVGG